MSVPSFAEEECRGASWGPIHAWLTPLSIIGFIRVQVQVAELWVSYSCLLCKEMALSSDSGIRLEEAQELLTFKNWQTLQNRWTLTGVHLNSVKVFHINLLGCFMMPFTHWKQKKLPWRTFKFTVPYPLVTVFRFTLRTDIQRCTMFNSTVSMTQKNGTTQWKSLSHKFTQFRQHILIFKWLNRSTCQWFPKGHLSLSHLSTWQLQHTSHRQRLSWACSLVGFQL